MLDEELHTSYLKQLHLPKDMDNLFESDAKEFQKMMMMYSCAIKEVKTKLQVLNDEFSMTKNRNPIEFIKKICVSKSRFVRLRWTFGQA